MNRVARLLIAVFLCLSLAGCSLVKNVKEPSPSPSPTPTPQESTNSFDEPEDNSAESSQDNGEKNSGTEGENVITVYCDNREIVELIKKFQELHPNFEYEIQICTEYADENPDRVHYLINGRLGVIPDIYSVAREDIYKFTKGSDYQYAVPFEELGIDVEKLVKEAEIPQYMIDACTNPEEKLVALGYQNTAGAFIYRRSIAKKVWGADDPAVINGKIGPGWDKFMNAAADLKAKGYSICSGIYDLWRPFEMNAEQGWFRDGQLVVDPAREEFLDIARKMVEKGYTNNTLWWTDEWYADMKGEGEREVFGFFGPYWLVKYVIADNSGKTYGDWAVCDPPAGFFWGNTMFLAHRNTRHKEAVGEIIRWLTLDTSETGAQYLWATGEISGSMEIPSSAIVTKKYEYKYDFLGGQDLFEAYLSAAQYARGNSLSEYDSTISLYWQEMAIEYAQGLKTREQAIADFKERVDQRLDYYAKMEAYWSKPEETGGPKKDYKGTIRVYSDSGDLFTLVDKFLELHPDFEYEIEYQREYPDNALNNLLNGKSDAEPPDIYGVQMHRAIMFTQGSEYRHAIPFDELGIDVGRLAKEAAVSQYIIDVGTSPEGKIVALGCDSSAGAFIYRRSIAKEVWGTDDPAVVRNKIGPGWVKFFEAAADLAAKGYAICSDIYDLWIPVEMSARWGWVKDGRLMIGPEREAFLDYARKLVANNYTSNAKWWTQEWYAQMSGEGEKEVFGYMAPYWFVNYVLAPMSGGSVPGEGTYGDWAVCDPPASFWYSGSVVMANKNTKYRDAVAEIIRWLTLDTSETGCQYLIAKGELFKGDSLPASAAVIKKLSRKSDFLGGQDVFEAYLSAVQHVNRASLTEYDVTINNIWLEEAEEYAEGRKTREQAIADFKQRVSEQLGLIVD